MSDEILKFEGRMAVKDMERHRLEMRIRGLISSIRDILDPFAPADEINAEMAAQQTMELAEIQIQYKGLVAEIAALKRILRR